MKVEEIIISSTKGGRPREMHSRSGELRLSDALPAVHRPLHGVDAAVDQRRRTVPSACAHRAPARQHAANSARRRQFGARHAIARALTVPTAVLPRIHNFKQ